MSRFALSLSRSRAALVSSRTEKFKTNLMIFIRATILRDSEHAALETHSKYNMIRQVQQGQQGRGVALMPGTDRPMLPPLDEPQSQNSDSQNDGSK